MADVQDEIVPVLAEVAALLTPFDDRHAVVGIHDGVSDLEGHVRYPPGRHPRIGDHAYSRPNDQGKPRSPSAVDRKIRRGAVMRRLEAPPNNRMIKRADSLHPRQDALQTTRRWQARRR